MDLCDIVGFQLVNIDAGCNHISKVVPPVPDYLIISSRLLLIHQRPDFLPQGIEDRKPDI
jgi:hypothetical protein